MAEAALALADIQGTVLRRRPLPYHGAYLLFRIEAAVSARALVTRLLPHVTSAADWAHPAENAWINVAFSHEGLRLLGVPAQALSGFPPEFQQGMAARKAYLGDVDVNDPILWDLPHGGTGLHIGILVMAGSPTLRDEKIAIGLAAAQAAGGVSLVSRLDVGLPPTMREHFGFVDGISRPFIEGEGGVPLPGQGGATKAGEFLLGYENELGRVAQAGGPAALWRNGTFLSVRKIRQDVAAFRRFLRDNAADGAAEEFLAAKMMGRWRSGCPLALSPDRDDPVLAEDAMRNNDFEYFESDPDGRKTPLGSHIRRANPRDALQSTLTNNRLHRVLRRGSAYGPVLPEGVLEDDGQDRGAVIAIVNADPGRQFEFVHSQWMNDGEFISQGAQSDPIIGRKDIANEFTFAARPVRRKLTGLKNFTTVRGGEHVFLPGLGGLRWIADLGQ